MVEIQTKPIVAKQSSKIGRLVLISALVGLAAGILGAAVVVFSVWGFLPTSVTKEGTVVQKNEQVVVQEDSAVIDAVTKISPSVVSILTTTNVYNFFGSPTQEQGGGTGFILTSDGLIATNKHVVSDTSATLKVLTSDGKSYDAKIKAVDSLNDFAVIKIEATGLKVAELGDSDLLKIGQRVIAVGNALGEFQNTVTLGVVSATDRTITAGSEFTGTEQLEGLIQTDTAINPGNSGGPLINLLGQVVGINTAIAQEAQNIGFAIPINQAKVSINSVEKTGKIVRPYLGIRYIPVTSEVKEINNLKADHGILVTRGENVGELAIVPGSPADKAGVEENDIILSVDGKEIGEKKSFLAMLADYKPGDKVQLKIMRGDKEITLTATLGEHE